MLKLIKPKTIKTEAGRLNALFQYDILGEKEDPDFNDFVALAAAACDAPIAMINFVDSDRTWTKASFGHDRLEMPRHASFCAQTILQNDALVIKDARSDERFLNSELAVGDSKIRFYAGSPIVTSDGYAIGAISVMGREPRELTPVQRLSLRAIARQVIAQLELRKRLGREDRAKRDLAISDALEFKTVFESLPHGVAKLDLNARFIDSNSAFLTLLGYSKQELCQLTEYDVTHADDLGPLSEVGNYPIKPGSKLSKFRKRYIAKDGSVVWTQVSGTLVTGEDDNDD